MGGEDRREGKSVAGERGREVPRGERERRRNFLLAPLLVTENFCRDRREESAGE